MSNCTEILLKKETDQIRYLIESNILNDEQDYHVLFLILENHIQEIDDLSNNEYHKTYVNFMN